MYLPPAFEESRPEELRDLITRYPLGTLVTHGPSGLDANHLVFQFDASQGDHGTLHTHVARSNSVWRELSDGQEVLAIFRGPDGYISPNWYPTKPETHRVVPTWNYLAIHVHGRAAVRDDPKYLRGVVGHLTKTHEATQDVPWAMGDGPHEFIEDLLTKIVAIDIGVTRLVGKAKLSQNRDLRDVHGAIAGLRRSGHNAVADAMDHYAKPREEP
jgi:transcriptional regulator